MDKIRKTWQNFSLRKSLLLCILGFVLLDLALSAVTSAFCDRAITSICAAYPSSIEKYYLTTEQGKQLGEGAYIGEFMLPLSSRDKRLTSFLQFLPVIAVPLYSAVCILAASFLFYHTKLKKPLAALKNASEKIAQNDLNFSITCENQDELGELCASFETMRAALADNLAEMWRQMEERRRLNAAFAHELRTPLTVLKGYNEMLLSDSSPTTRKTAAAMERHISRLEHYADSMSRLQRLEDAKPEYKPVPLQPFLTSLGESAALVCKREGKRLLLLNETSLASADFDAEFISQVSGNLLSNAVRFARTSVTVSFRETENGLLLTVSDNGDGFDENTIRQAVKPFFTGNVQDADSCHSQHFGLGLYICKLLCEHHGGCLQLETVPTGAKVTAYFQFGKHP